MVRDGLLWVMVPLGAAMLAAAAGYRFESGYFFVASGIFFLLAVFMAYFFRDPPRRLPAEFAGESASLVVAPADGRITRIELIGKEAATAAAGPSATIVSIFLSPFDVHINRAPIAGEVTSVAYTKGRFMIATRDEASLINEQNALTIRGERITVVCRQIAGVLARRIVCWKRVGERVAQGERFGLIKFSSRTDLVLPPEVEVTVSVGERVRGGASVIGRIR